MAKVILATILASPDKSWAPGDEFECSDAEAARLIENGYATPADAGEKGAPRRRTATAPAPSETAGG